MSASLRPALFIDRDGTLIADAHYLADPAGVVVLPGTGAAMRTARAAGVPVVIVTNQSGIARGLITPAQYDATRDRTVALLEAEGGAVLATYHCPHRAETTGGCDCRKPGLGMYRQAALDHQLDLARSAYIGDRWRDVQPALATGGLGILVPGRETPVHDITHAETAAREHANVALARSLPDAVTLALSRLGIGTVPPAAKPAPARIAVLASGGGSNLQVLLDHFRGPAAATGEIVWVGSDKPAAGALARAAAAGVATGVIADPRDGEALVSTLRAAGADLLVLAGYLKLVPATVVAAYHGRVLNIHPALLPAFGGAGMYGQRIHTAVLEHGALVTGATVHFVDAHYDRGPIIAQWPVPVLPGDTPASLGARVLRVEHRLFPLCVAAVASGAIMLDTDGRVHGHLGGPALVTEPAPDGDWRFGLVPTATDAAPDFIRDISQLFPR